MSTTFVTVPQGTTYVISADGKRYLSYTDAENVCSVEMPIDQAAILVKSNPVVYQITSRSLSASSPTPPPVPA